MRTLRILGISVVLLIGGVIASCSNEKEILRQQVGMKTDSISTLKRDIQLTQDNLTSAQKQLSFLTQERDSLSAAQDATQKKLSRASRDLKKVRVDFAELEAVSQRQLAARDSALNEVRKNLIDTTSALSIALSNLQDDKNRIQTAYDQQTNLIARVQPWYFKYKHDATQRNFIEVLFAADKAKKPDYQEPDFSEAASLIDTTPKQSTTTEPIPN